MSSTIIDQLPEWLKVYDPILLLIAAGIMVFLFVLIIIILISRAAHKSTMPSLDVSSFQIAPLRKDAFLKLHNSGEQLTLLSMTILEATDIHIKNQVAGHILPPNGNYNILLEAAANNKIGANFKIAITFVTVDRKTYQQIFTLDPIESISLRKAKK